MRQSIAILAFLASAALAEDVVSFAFPGGLNSDLVVAPQATVESVNPSTTAMLIACPTDTAEDECGWGSGLELKIIGGSRYEAVMTAASLTVSYGCDYNKAATEMTCTAGMTGEDEETAVLSGTDAAFVTATIVEGAELLSGGTASATATASASVSGSAASHSSAAAASSGMRTSAASASGTAAAGSHASGSVTATASSSLPQSTGAAARFGIEGTALLALAGAAALNVL